MEMGTFTGMLINQVGTDYVRYAFPAIRKAFVLGGRSLTEAKQMAGDIANTALIGASQTFSEQGGSSVGTYFVRGAFIAARNAVRKLNNTRTVCDSTQEDRDGAGSDSARGRLFHDHGVSTDREVFGFEDREMLANALATLTNDERRLVTEYIGMNRTSAELSEFGGASGITYKVNKILTKLRTQMK